MPRIWGSKLLDSSKFLSEQQKTNAAGGWGRPESEQARGTAPRIE